MRPRIRAMLLRAFHQLKPICEYAVCAQERAQHVQETSDTDAGDNEAGYQSQDAEALAARPSLWGPRSQQQSLPPKDSRGELHTAQKRALHLLPWCRRHDPGCPPFITPAHAKGRRQCKVVRGVRYEPWGISSFAHSQASGATRR